VIEAMQNQRMKPGVTGYDFPGVSSGRVTIEYALYVFTNADGVFLKISVFYQADDFARYRFFVVAKKMLRAKLSGYII